MDLIQQMMQVPPNHLISLALPADIPAGDMAIIAINVPAKLASEKSLLDLAGGLAGSKTFSGDSVETIRKMRDEW
jgi:hypothetical protein